VPSYDGSVSRFVQLKRDDEINRAAEEQRRTEWDRKYGARLYARDA